MRGGLGLLGFLGLAWGVIDFRLGVWAFLVWASLVVRVWLIWRGRVVGGGGRLGCLTP